jgi:hypothetical protein
MGDNVLKYMTELSKQWMQERTPDPNFLGYLIVLA